MQDHVHYAGCVHALESSNHLLEDVLQLGGREQFLLDALTECGAGVAADDDVVFALEDDGFNALHAWTGLEPPARKIHFPCV